MGIFVFNPIEPTSGNDIQCPPTTAGERLMGRRGLHAVVTTEGGAADLPAPDLGALRRRLEGMVGPEASLREVEVHPVIGSTNQHALDAGREGLLVVALEQTEGRGRHGSPWSSPPGGLYLSYVPLAAQIPRRPTDLPLLASLAVADVVDAHLGREGVTGHRALLKWPNDVLVGDGKVAGVLVQSREPPLAAVGIGLNVNASIALEGPRPPEERPLRPRSLRDLTGRPLDLAQVLVDLVVSLTGRLAAGLDGPAMEEYRSRLHTLGRRVAFTDGGERLIGTAVDISPDGGGLLVRLPGGKVRKVTSGEVRHVRSVEG